MLRQFGLAARTKIQNPAHTAYSFYAKATASRRDNLRRSADELRVQLAKDEKALLELDEITVQTLSPFDLTLSMRVRVPREGNFASDYRTAA